MTVASSFFSCLCIYRFVLILQATRSYIRHGATFPSASTAACEPVRRLTEFNSLCLFTGAQLPSVQGYDFKHKPFWCYGRKLRFSNVTKAVLTRAHHKRLKTSFSGVKCGELQKQSTSSAPRWTGLSLEMSKINFASNFTYWTDDSSDLH